jgi:hypothetical protein
MQLSIVSLVTAVTVVGGAVGADKHPHGFVVGVGTVVVVLVMLVIVVQILSECWLRSLSGGETGTGVSAAAASTAADLGDDVTAIPKKSSKSSLGCTSTSTKFASSRCPSTLESRPLPADA